MKVNVDAVVSKLNWAILPISCLVVGVCYLDRSNIAYMQLQLQQPPPVGLSFSEVLYGQASGLFFLGYSAFQIPSNLILVRLTNAHQLRRNTALEARPIRAVYVKTTQLECVTALPCPTRALACADPSGAHTAMQTQLGAPLWLAIIVALWGACAAVMALMRTATHFMVLRFLLGLFEAGTFPGIWCEPG